MTLTRWKMMAGVLGVSIGGLAAVAGQCPKTDASKTGMVSAEAPPAPAKVMPTAPALPDLPPPAPTPASEVPPLPLPLPVPATPTKASELPPLPAPTEPVKKPDTPVSSPAMPPVIPIGGTEPVLPPPLPSTGKPTPTAPANPLDDPGPIRVNPTTPATPPVPDFPMVKPTAPTGGGMLPPSAPPSGNAASPPVVAPSDPLITDAPAITVTKPAVATPAIAQAATKFRILLRVGEGEPSFEVRCGDDLVLKVICEKVDIKSPEKGSGLSSVKASGKVRFAGFGAEGTCEELSFLAGTGEVSMAGAVNIKVKDKIGRVESELSTEAVKYKLDPCAKP